MYLLIVTARRYCALLWMALCAPFERRRRLSGGLLLLLAAPVFLLLQLVHGLGWLLDEVVFRRYRQVAVRQPLFIIGPPRTGTTHLHQVMSLDEQSTTFRTWECLFAPSITERRLILALAALDRWLGAPVGRLIRWLGTRFLSSMDDIHPLRLEDPEEDFLVLLPLLSCFILIVAFPRAGWLWRTARLDTEVDERERRALMKYYRACIQKHLYVFGEEKRFLSKNASYCGFLNSLLEEFPDAGVIATVRDPLQAVPSQLSSLRPALATLGYAEIPGELRESLVELMVFYFQHLNGVARDKTSRVVCLENNALRLHLADSVKQALERLDMTPDEAFVEKLLSEDRKSRTHRSRHSYSLAEFSLSEELLRERFAAIYDSTTLGLNPVISLDECR